jgi:hypothetical protein
VARLDGTIDGGPAAGTLDFHFFGASHPVTINFANNSCSALNGGAPFGLTRLDNFIGGAGSNTLIGDDRPIGNQWSITGPNAGNMAGSTFSSFQNLRVGLYGGTVNFADGAGLDGMLDGGAGSTMLNYAAYTTSVMVNLSTNTATGAGSVQNIQQLRGGSRNNSLTGNAAGTTTFFATPGNTSITGVGGTNTLVGPNAVTTWNITANNGGYLTFDVNITAFSGVQNLTGGAAADTFNLADGAGVDGNIDGGGGSNTLNDASYTTAITVDLSANTASGVGGTIANLQTFAGGSAANTLAGPNAATTWSITSNNARTLTGGISFSAFQNLTGGSGADNFVFSNGAGVSGGIDGGGGTNALNYAAYTGNVIVNLQTAGATGVGGGIANIQNVTGGNGAGGYNILVGNGGNVLIGGNGRRNLLIAGATASTLIGGNGEDILIGGTTDYDTDAAALLDIMSVWTGVGTYASRVDRLVNDSTYAFSLNSGTVHSNGGGNTLTGKPGGSTALDLYFAALALGDTTDATGSDTVVAIA